MDPKRFDAVSQRLAASSDRRRVIGAVGALVSTAALGLPVAEIDAKPKRCMKFGKDCVQDKRVL